MIDIDFGHDQGPNATRRELTPRVRGKAVCIRRRHLETLMRSVRNMGPELDTHLVTLVAGRRLAKRHAHSISVWSRYAEASCGDYDAASWQRWLLTRRSRWE